MSLLLHSVNTVPTATALGDYDGGTGLSQPEREAKINSSYLHCWTTRSRLARLRGWTGYGIANYVNIVEDDDSGWEPKHKRVPQNSKLFTSRSENARKSKHIFEIRSIELVNAEHCKVEVGSGNSVRTFYQVHIVLNLPAPAQTSTLTVWGLRANTYCLFCYLHGKWQILKFKIKLNLRHKKLWTFYRNPTLIPHSKQRTQLRRSQQHSSERFLAPIPITSHHRPMNT